MLEFKTMDLVYFIFISHFFIYFHILHLGSEISVISHVTVATITSWSHISLLQNT